MEGPVRTCLVCRERRLKPQLVRLVAVDGTATADPSGRQPGRGAYVCPAAPCLDELVARGPGRLAKALRLDPTVARVDEDGLRAAARETQRDLTMTAAVPGGSANAGRMRSVT